MRIEVPLRRCHWCGEWFRPHRIDGERFSVRFCSERCIESHEIYPVPKVANLESLKDKIVRPGIDEKLIPLMLYKGNTNLGRMHRLWNFTIGCMEAEVVNYSQAIKLSMNPDYAHLCGPLKPLQTSTLYGLFGRLVQNPRVTDNIPGLTQYVRDMDGFKAKLCPISLYTNDPSHPERGAPWRIRDYSPEYLAKRKARAEQKFREKMARQDSKAIFYPYLIHKPKDGDDEAALVMEVHNAVPKGLPHDVRADVCQDLLVAILAGEIDRAALKDNIRGYTRKIQKMSPSKYGPISLDALIASEDDRDGYAVTKPPGYGRMEW